MMDKGKTDLDSLFISENGGTTSRKVLQAKAILEDATEGTTVVHRYQPKAPHISRVRRLLNWFKRD